MWVFVAAAFAGRVEAIVGGAPAERSNVVALAAVDPVTSEAFVFCSGTQIADEWVLTAAHCVLADLGDLVPYVRYGADGSADAVQWREAHANPAYDGYHDDAGLVRLASPRPQVPRMVLNDAPLDASWVGERVTFYGFGATSDGADDTGLLRSAQVPIDRVEAGVFLTYSPDANVCQGDSGGPSTIDGPHGPEQIGVSSLVYPSCVGGGAFSTRVDTQLAFIASYVPDFATTTTDPGTTEEPGTTTTGGEEPPAPEARGCATGGRGAGWAALAALALTARGRPARGAPRTPAAPRTASRSR